MIKIALLGATGSLGTQSLEVLAKYPETFRVVGQAARKRHSAVITATTPAEIIALTTSPEVDLVVNVLSGMAGVEASLAALRAGKTLLLGNKESVVAAGPELMSLAKLGQNLFPLDSEHQSIHEILLTHPQKPLKSITLTASGGPFFGLTASDLATVTPADALAHPTWNMGPKVTIESATLINKGLEVIEAHYLFNLPLEGIDVLVDRTSNIHAIAHFGDGTNLAYCAAPDMRQHLENALRRAAHLPPTHSHVRPLSPADSARLQQPDHQTFPGIQLVKTAHAQNRLPQFLQHEELAIQSFLDAQISFTELLQSLSDQLHS